MCFFNKMQLNIINNYKALYYSLLSNFYLILNSFLPFYDDVIISMHNESTKSLFGDINSIKQLRMMELLNKLENNDKIILNKNNNTILVAYNCRNNLYNDTVNNADANDANDANDSSTDSSTDSSSDSGSDSSTDSSSDIDLNIKKTIETSKKNI